MSDLISTVFSAVNARNVNVKHIPEVTNVTFTVSLTTLGSSALQVLRRNAANTGFEFATLAFADLVNPPTTLAGYGITDGLDGSPIQQYLTVGTAQYKPHASIAYGKYGFFFDRETSLATRINATNLLDKTNFTAGAMSEIVDGGNGFFYGISEQGTCPLYKFNPATLTTTTLVAAPPIVLGLGPSITADGLGNLYVVGGDANPANSRVLKYRASDGVLLVNRLITGKRYAHACRYINGALWLSGILDNISNGWWAKLSVTDLTDIYAPVDFNPPTAPPVSRVLVPTDDFANDSTYAYFVSESVEGSGADWMARITLSSGAVSYYTLPGGELGAAFTAVWDGATSILIPQFLRRGLIAVFDTITATFSSKPINVYGPLNELIKVGNSWLVSTYSNAGGNAEAGVVTRLNIGELYNFGPYARPNGDQYLPDTAQLIWGDGVTTVMSKDFLAVPEIDTSILQTDQIANLATDGLVKVTGGNGTLDTADPGVDFFAPHTGADGRIGIKLPRYDTYQAADEGLLNYLAGSGLNFETANGTVNLGDPNGLAYAILGGTPDQAFSFSTASINTTFAPFGYSVSGLAVGRYEFEIVMQVDPSAAGGHKYRLLFAGSVVEITATVISIDLTTSAICVSGRLTASGGAGLGQTGATSVQTTLRGSFLVDSGTATFEPQFAQQAAVGTSTVLAGVITKLRISS